jgi:hypothetical protein
MLECWSIGVLYGLENEVYNPPERMTTPGNDFSINSHRSNTPVLLMVNSRALYTRILYPSFQGG